MIVSIVQADPLLHV